MKHGAKYVAVVLAMSFLAAFVSVISYLWFAGLFSAKFDDFIFAGAIAISLVPASTVVAIVVATTHKVVRRRSAVVAASTTVLMATCGGAAVGVWAANGSPHVSLRLAIEVCVVTFALLSSLFLVFVRQKARRQPPN